MSYNTILYETAHGVLTITLNRPDKLNAATDELLSELADAFKKAGRDAEVRAVILTGAGRGFCAGQDLGAVQSRYEDDDAAIAFGEHLRHSWNIVIQRMRALPKPILCAVNGVAAGAGMSLVLASDLRYASDKASFVQAFVNIGLIPDSGSTWTLPRLIGPTRALEMMLTGRKVTAQEAEAWGMINGIFAGEALQDEVRAIAERLAAMPTRAIGLIKQATDYAADSTLNEALEYEADLQDLAGRTQDHREGVTAFIEKRKPIFTGE
ncbi:MAG: enoyl-CoA hydratase/isomerase family protein [Anaerolineales bacterium]|nr:enoyl-CoA hydratase/isomerase family protein [Anaerolineales bacterium]MCB9128138.1 enoyl-CoA hydratase/isomerase family protein [Ardenticatenales bacterium]